MGPYRCIVTDNNDPEKRGRIIGMIPDLFWDCYEEECIASPWIEAGNAASDTQGFVNIPPVGEAVWVWVVDSSEEGECWELMYQGGPGSGDAQDSSLPNTAKGEDSESDAAFKGGVTRPSGLNVPRYPMPSADMRLVASAENEGEFTDNIVNPEDERAEVIRGSEIAGLPNTPNEGEYPHVRVIKTPGGVCIEVDDTPGAERVHIWHPSGAYWEISQGGRLVERSANRFSETVNDSHIVKGTKRTYVDDTNYTTIQRNDLKTVKGRKLTMASQIGMQASTQALLKSEGSLTILSEGTCNQQHAAGRILEVGGPDIITRFSKSESVFSTSATTFNADMKMVFTGLNLLSAAGSIAASALPGSGGACTTLFVAPQYEALTSVSGCHTEVGGLGKLALPVTPVVPGGWAANAAQHLATDGFIVRGLPNTCFTTSSPTLTLKGAQPLVKWPDMLDVLIGIQTLATALSAALATASGGATAASTAAIGDALPLKPGLTTLGTNLATAGTAAGALAATLTTKLGIMNNPATAGYTVALRSE